ncbi:MAG: sigma-70 family RNA polymerase sigma factor [Myxococcales bacterium]|nr:sigma-70 family RNA polymerase sigma factor [Myxococcales bacterium]
MRIEAGKRQQPTVRAGTTGEQAFWSIFESHAPSVWRFARQLGVSAADLDDVVQEVFLVVHERLSEFDPAGPASVRTWICAICLNVVRNYRRRAFRTREKGGLDADALVEPTDVEEEFARRERLVQLMRRLADLDEGKRTVLWLHDVEGLPMAEITSMLGIPLKTGYSRLRAARAVLEAALAEEGGST